ncbi:HDOD domain-containing protein [Clostridium cavendishii DSM 21758]|uniref:HDOD domain-containing protein n=1 Tax=Clostridium cavendishii DSM 21758 TaxID=1121302 RepID=A0A1M6QVD9_9CLOT|nr:HD domain-containing protein [Clostridium cavendishii]SHK24110.1 HDOD domain-containing protein [Clostridium cavendishii DSM 21758]
MIGFCVPTLNEAENLLREAENLNPGDWIQHSIYTAEASKLIASNCPTLNPETAYILGLLHDIGRRFGVTSMRHSIDGYNFAMSKGYPLLAQICLTHSHPLKLIDEAFGVWDCSTEEYKFVEDFLKSTKYDDYDKLIQLCDALALPSGFCLIEKRLMDVALRHGIHKYALEKWKATFKLKEYFEKMIGKSIYTLLPGVIENTFEL